MDTVHIHSLICQAGLGIRAKDQRYSTNINIPLMRMDPCIDQDNDRIFIQHMFKADGQTFSTLDLLGVVVQTDGI